MTAAAHEVKFQKGLYLVVVQWNVQSDTTSQAAITALVGALEKTLPGK